MPAISYGKYTKKSETLRLFRNKIGKTESEDPYIPLPQAAGFPKVFMQKLGRSTFSAFRPKPS